MSLEAVAPDGYRAVKELNNYVSKSLDGKILTLVKVRASIVNGSAFCIDMHSGHAVRGR